jgi:hypothetical protein
VLREKAGILDRGNVELVKDRRPLIQHTRVRHAAIVVDSNVAVSLETIRRGLNSQRLSKKGGLTEVSARKAHSAHLEFQRQVSTIIRSELRSIRQIRPDELAYRILNGHEHFQTFAKDFVVIPPILVGH